MASAGNKSAGKEWAGKDDWDTQRAAITRLYSMENRTLREVIEIMERDHSFYATPKMYKQRLKLWGLTKYFSRQRSEASSLGQKKQTSLELRAKSIQGGPKAPAQPKRSDDVRDLSLIAAGRVSPLPRLYIHVSSPSAYEEGTYHAMREYYYASFRSFYALTQGSPPTGTTETEPSAKNNIGRTDLFSRFDIALMKLHAQPPDPASLAEGMKIMRVCFARFPELLAEDDPELITNLLDLFRRLKVHGNTFIAEQLRRHIHWLSQTPGQPRSAAVMSRLLSQEDMLHPSRSSALTQIAIDAGRQELGPWHFKTLQLIGWHLVSSELDKRVRERKYRQLYSQMEAEEGKDVFDRRHLDILVNVANLHLRNFDPNDTVEVVQSVLQNPDRLAKLRDYPDQAYDMYWLAGKAIGKMGKHVEAEPYFRKAFDLAGENSEADVAFLSGINALELNLRDQNRLEEANELSAMRQAHIRESLEKVGEKESAT